MRKGKKTSGGRYKKYRKSRLYERQGKPRLVRLGKEKKKALKTIGGNLKTVLLATDKVNIIDPKTKKSQTIQIKNVLETPANRFWARRNIITRGTVINTEKGKAKVTNRPGQEGSVQAVLME